MGSGEAVETRTTRKIYTISKAREKWSDEEHEKFIQALQKRGRNWKAIVLDIGTRTVAQVRSHAQKYFLRLEKEGHQEEIPPPRPKKRSARPYPVQARESPVRELKPKKKARRERSEAPPALRGRDTIFGAASGAASGSGEATDSGGRSAAVEAEAEANFSKLYAIVGSMFENSVSVPQQLSTIDYLPAEQREPLLLMLANLSANLRHTVAHQQPGGGVPPALLLDLPQLLPPPMAQWDASTEPGTAERRPRRQSKVTQRRA